MEKVDWWVQLPLVYVIGTLTTNCNLWGVKTAKLPLHHSCFLRTSKSAFTDLQWVGKGFTDPLASVPTDCELQISSFTDTWSDVIQNFLLKKGCAPDLSPQPQTHAQVIFV
jgi:hypothetical protein